MKNKNKKQTALAVAIVVCILLALWAIQAKRQSSGGDSSNQAEKIVSAVTTAARIMTFEETVNTFGNMESKYFALVSARIPGIIDEIFIEEGDYVTAEKSDLFQTDKIRVTQAKEIASHSVSVSEFSHKAMLATVKRVEADFEKARLDYERHKRLFENDNAVTGNALEIQESRYVQLKAALEEARAGADLAERQTEQARNNLVIAEKDLEDSLVKAPLTGYVSERYQEPGEMAGTGTPILRIDDPGVLEVSAFLPAEYYNRVITNQTEMNVIVNGIDIGEIPLTFKSPVIDSSLRNFRVKALLKNPPEGVASGSIAQIRILLDRRESTGVPRRAVLRRTAGDIIFIAREGKAKMIPVETGLNANGWVEIISGGIREGDAVVTMGQNQLNDEAPLSVLREDDN